MTVKFEEEISIITSLKNIGNAIKPFWIKIYDDVLTLLDALFKPTK